MKVLVPDAEGNRIVPMNDMDGTGWIEKTNTTLGTGSDIVPWDIDVAGSGWDFFKPSGMGESDFIFFDFDDC